MRAKARPVGESLTHCAECDEPIPPEARRQALPGGVKLCIDCVRDRDAAFKTRPGGINRRGSKDSQLK